MRSEAFNNYVIDNYRDADVSNEKQRIDPSLILYSGITFMTNTN